MACAISPWHSSTFGDEVITALVEIDAIGAVEQAQRDVAAGAPRTRRSRQHKDRQLVQRSCGEFAQIPTNGAITRSKENRTLDCVFLQGCHRADGVRLEPTPMAPERRLDERLKPGGC